MFRSNIIIVLFCVSVYAQEEYYYRLNQSCIIEKQEGTKDTVEWGECKKLQYCPMAVRLINVNKIHPQLCYRDNKLDVACCPSNSSLSKTGVFRELYLATNDNSIRSNNIACNYDGNEPMICCGIPRKSIEYKEPKDCPHLPSPPMDFTGSRKYDRVLLMCWNYQKHFNKCVSKEDGKGYTRKNTCGIPDSDDRTIGGKAAALKEFPHMAVLGQSNSDKSKDHDINWIAGGSLLSDKFILTAAHALQENGDRIRYALLGSLNKTDIRSGLLYVIIRHIPHPGYDSTKQRHDIALVELERRVEFSEFIRPICLPLPNMDFKSHRQYIAAGWGKTEHRKTSEILLRVQVKQVNPRKCADYNNGDRTFNRSSMICAKGSSIKDTKLYMDTCQGDSGGPLMISMREVKCSYVVMGVVSHGAGCGSGAPSVYTMVEFYRDWIIDTVWPELIKFT